LNYIKKISVRDTIITLREDGIIHTHPIKGTKARHELEDAKAVMEAIGEISCENRYPILSEFGDYYVTMDALNFYRNQPPMGLACAMIVRSFTQRWIGNFFLKFADLQVPIRLFDSEKEAVAWLLEFNLGNDGNKPTSSAMMMM
jgi:hypothetical protein